MKLMRTHKFPGFFVAIEGLDGSGSDEVAKLLAKSLKKEKIVVVSVKEPTQGPVGQVIKKLLLKKERPISPILLEFLFAADRALLMEKKIIPALKKGKLVVGDRCLWSSIAYRSLELPFHWLLEVNARFIVPNICYFIDVSPRLCAQKIKKGEDDVQVYFEEGKLRLIREGYRWLVGKFPHRFKVVDGEREKKKIVEGILINLKSMTGFPKAS